MYALSYTIRTVYSLVFKLQMFEQTRTNISMDSNVVRFGGGGGLLVF